MAIRPFTRFSPVIPNNETNSLFSPFERTRISLDQDTTKSDALNVERRAVRMAGGHVNKRLDGPDGRSILFNKPIEVKYALKDHRFRINRRDHEQMLRENGTYIFIHGNAKRQLSAQQVDSLLAYDWMVDRAPQYSHSFVFVKDIFG